jgi:hypothetical protein
MKRAFIFFILLLILFASCSIKSEKKECLAKNARVFFGMATKRINLFIDGEKLSGNYRLIEDTSKTFTNFIVQKKNKFGLVNKKMQIVLPIEYDSIFRAIDYFYIGKDDKYGIISTKGYLHIPLIYDHIECEWNNQSLEFDRFLVGKDKLIGSVDYFNNIIVPIKYDGISNWVEYGPRNHHYIKKDSLYGLVDNRNGEESIPPKYDGIQLHYLWLTDPFQNQKEIIKIIEILYVFVEKDGRFGVVNGKGQEVFSYIYETIHLSTHLKFFVKNQNRWDKYTWLGKLIESGISEKEINSQMMQYTTEQTNYQYHLHDCMLFPKN